MQTADQIVVKRYAESGKFARREILDILQWELKAALEDMEIDNAQKALLTLDACKAIEEKP